MGLLRSIRIGVGIRSRLILLALIAAVPFVWYRVADIHSAERANLASIRGDVIRIAERSATVQSEIFAEVRALLTVTAKVPVVSAGKPDACGAFLRSIKDSRGWIRNFAVTDLKGRIVCASTPQALGIDLGDRAYVKSALATHEFTLSDYIFSRLDDRPILAAAYPALDQNGRIIGILVATMKLSWFDQASASVGKVLNARVLLVDAAGTVIAHYPQTATLKNTVKVDRRLLAAADTRESQWFESRDEDGVRRLYGVADLAGTDARLAVGLSIETALSASREKIATAYANAALLTAVIVLLAWLGGEAFLITPLRNLLQATRRLSDGDLDARARIPRSSHEFRELAESFNTMADRLERLATIDGLTGVANRRRFDQYLSEEWRRAMRTRMPVTVALIDVDRFKSFNDDHGHQAGDECLKLIASELTLFARRSEDLVGRYGGEEFVISLPGLSREDAGRHMERVRAAIASLSLPEFDVAAGQVTISIGVSTTVPTPTAPAESIIAAADAALYEAKRAGRNCVKFREPDNAKATAAA